MPDSETYGVRVEKKLDQLRQEMGELNNNVIRLSERDEYYRSQAVANRRDIDLLQADMNQAKGGLTFAKGLGGTALAALVAFGGYVFQGNRSLERDNALLNQKWQSLNLNRSVWIQIWLQCGIKLTNRKN